MHPSSRAKLLLASSFPSTWKNMASADLFIFFCTGHPVVLQNRRTIVNTFVFSPTQYFILLTYWQQVSAIKSLSSHLYIKFKTGYM